MSSDAPPGGGVEEDDTGQPAGAPVARHALHDVPDAGIYVVNEAGIIVEVNPRAEELLGRPASELVGHNAHDLLHRGSSGQPLARSRCPIMHAFVGGYTKQGSPLWHERGDGVLRPMSWLATPYMVGPGERGSVVIFHEAVASETEGAQGKQNGDDLSELERLALLAETTTRLTSTLETEVTLQRLARLLVPRLADWAIVDLFTEEREVWRSTVVHHEGNSLVHREDLQGPLPPVPLDSPMPLSRALRGAAPDVTGPEAYHGTPDIAIAEVQRNLIAATGIHTMSVAPIQGVREVLGALTLGRSERPGAFDDLPLLQDIARRAGLALDNARLYQAQRQVSEIMQRHLLPQLPSVPQLQMAVRYLPASNASQVGGDWYDSFFLPDGAVALAIGDVVGHDLDAAAAMAQIRNMLRAYAWSYQEPPSIIVDRLDQAVEHLAEASMATLVFARLEVSRTTGERQVWWTNAGHPPPLLVTYEGETRYLNGDANPMIGTGLRYSRSDSVEALPPRATLLFYTDGLIESPARSLQDGLDRLRANAAELAQRPLATFCDLVLSRTRPEDNEDDVAVLAVRTPGW